MPIPLKNFVKDQGLPINDHCLLITDSGVRLHVAQEAVEGGRVHWFDEVMVESGLLGALLVLLLSPAGQSDEDHVFSPRLFPDVPGRIEAVELGQADVEQDDL